MSAARAQWASRLGPDPALDPSLGPEPGGGVVPTSIAFWALAGYMALFVIRPWEKLFPWMQVISTERPAALAALAAIAAAGRLRIDLDVASAAMFAFLGAVALSALGGVDPANSTDQIYRTLTQAVLFVMMTSAVRSARELAWLSLWWIVVMWLYLAKALWEFKVAGAYNYRMGVVRMIGIETSFGSPNSLAAGVTFTLPMLTFCWTRREVFGRRLRKWVELLLASYLLMGLATVVFTNSRSGMIKLAAFVALVTLGGRGLLRRLRYLAVALALGGVVWLVMPEENRNRFRTIWDSEAGPANAQESAEGRLQGLEAGVAMFGARPLVGVGPGNFLPYRMAYVDGIEAEAHSLPGQLLGETGLVGTLGFLGLVVAPLVLCARARKAAKGVPGPAADVASGVAVACLRTLALLVLGGAAGHIMFIYHWSWVAAFASIAARVASEARAAEARAARGLP